MAFKPCVEAELDHLRVDEHELQFGRMFLVEQRCNDSVQAYRFTHAGGARNKQMRHLCQVRYEHFVRNCAAHCHRQLHLAVLKCFRTEYRTDRYCLGVFIRHFYTDRALSGNRGYYSDSEGRQTHCDVVFEPLDFGDADALDGNNLIKGDRGANSGTDI